ncbi:MAG: hypothetical protein AAF809_14620 [Bacteroidota bacterium]
MEVHQQLKEIRAALEERGFAISERCFFSDVGFMPQHVGDLEASKTQIVPIYSQITVYAGVNCQLELRATWHGGIHWVHRPSSVEAAIEIATEALVGDHYPPLHWTVVQDPGEVQPLVGIPYSAFLNASPLEQERFLAIGGRRSDEP